MPAAPHSLPRPELPPLLLPCAIRSLARCFAILQAAAPDAGPPSAPRSDETLPRLSNASFPSAKKAAALGRALHAPSPPWLLPNRAAPPPCAAQLDPKSPRRGYDSRPAPHPSARAHLQSALPAVQAVRYASRAAVCSAAASKPLPPERYCPGESPRLRQALAAAPVRTPSPSLHARRPLPPAASVREAHSPTDLASGRAARAAAPPEEPLPLPTSSLVCLPLLQPLFLRASALPLLAGAASAFPPAPTTSPDPSPTPSLHCRETRDQ